MKKKLLIVDDEEAIRELLVDALEEADHEIATAQNGKEALLLSQQRHFDCILTDIRMPVMSGFEFIKELRKTNSTVPVIFFTTFNDSENMKQALKYGAFDFISKPHFEKLMETVKAAYASTNDSENISNKIKDLI